jgi:signal transduction histidine kinase
VTHAKPIIIEDLETDERQLNHNRNNSTFVAKSLLGVPLIYKGKVIGVLEAINKRIGKFSIEDQELLLILGSQAAVAIQNARFFAQSDLISEFVHELRTPLASLNTAANLLLKNDINSNKKNALVEVIQQETSRLSSLATAFLDISRLESGRSQFQFQNIGLSGLLNECVCLMQTQADQAGLSLKLFLPKSNPIFRGDPNKLKQAIINLLSNAIKYNRPNGEIVLNTQIENNTLRLRIIDNGIGIPQDHIDQLFTKYYRVPGSDQVAQGTGLGLVIVKRIIEGHGGDITVSSQPGEGTIFTITLPLIPE